MRKVKISKLQVNDEAEDSSVPFLRGILTRSLTRIGVPFEKSYKISSVIRAEFSSRQTVSRVELREKVHETLLLFGFHDEAASYQDAINTEPFILVTDRHEVEVPFSKGLLIQSLEICAMDRDSSYSIASTIEQRLHAENERKITSHEIESRTYQEITEQEGQRLADRYRKWLLFSRSGRPLVVLIGGTTGSGKSTVSVELSQRLNIVRTQSTDMLREVMRVMVPEALLPTLHTSSFEAYRALPHWDSNAESVDEPTMIAGYLSQSDHVKLAVDGVLKRVRNERVSLILEGVHIHPEVQNRVEKSAPALVVPIILAVLKKKQLKSQLEGRGRQITSRRSERYIRNFDKIWNLQSFLLSEADRFNIPIIEGKDEESVRKQAMFTISQYVARDYENRPTGKQTDLSKLEPQRK